MENKVQVKIVKDSELKAIIKKKIIIFINWSKKIEGDKVMWNSISLPNLLLSL